MRTRDIAMTGFVTPACHRDGVADEASRRGRHDDGGGAVKAAALRRRLSMTQELETQTEDDMSRDEDFRSALAIIRMLDALEKAHPQRERRIEPHLVWVLARRAGYMGYGADLLQMTRSAIQAGEADRREEQATAAAVGPAALDAATDCAGHA
jgi:hypothetical protein